MKTKLNSCFLLLTYALFAISLYTIFSTGIDLSSSKHTSMGDLTQDYIMGRALNDGINPYQPFKLLADRYLKDLKFCNELTVSPHTPFVVVIFSYLSFIDINFLSYTLYLFSIAALALSVFILTEKNYILKLIIFSVLTSSVPVLNDLHYGQLNCIILFILCLHYFLQQKNKYFLSGIFISLAVGLKFFAWIFIFYYALRKDWRTLFGIAFGTALISLIVFSHAPPDVLINYFTQVAPISSLEWANKETNLSVFSWVFKLFSSNIQYFEKGTCAPLKIIPEYPAYLKIAAYFILLAITFVCLNLIKNKKDNFFVFSSLIAISAVINPIAWIHYAVSLAPKLIEVIRRFLKKDYSYKNFIVSILLLFVLFYDLNGAIVNNYPKVQFGEMFQLGVVYKIIGLLISLALVFISVL